MLGSHDHHRHHRRRRHRRCRHHRRHRRCRCRRRRRNRRQRCFPARRSGGMGDQRGRRLGHSQPHRRRAGKGRSSPGAPEGPEPRGWRHRCRGQRHDQRGGARLRRRRHHCHRREHDGRPGCVQASLSAAAGYVTDLAGHGVQTRRVHARRHNNGEACALPLDPQIRKLHRKENRCQGRHLGAATAPPAFSTPSTATVQAAPANLGQPRHSPCSAKPTACAAL